MIFVRIVGSVISAKSLRGVNIARQFNGNGLRLREVLANFMSMKLTTKEIFVARSADFVHCELN